MLKRISARCIVVKLIVNVTVLVGQLHRRRVEKTVQCLYKSPAQDVSV